LKDSVRTIIDILEEEFRDVTAIPREELWEMFELLLKRSSIETLRWPEFSILIGSIVFIGQGMTAGRMRQNDLSHVLAKLWSMVVQ
jgi:hypothetical protein